MYVKLYRNTSLSSLFSFRLSSPLTKTFNTFFIRKEKKKGSKGGRLNVLNCAKKAIGVFLFYTKEALPKAGGKKEIFKRKQKLNSCVQTRSFSLISSHHV